MYKNRKFGNKNLKGTKDVKGAAVANENKRPLNVIREDASLKIARLSATQRSKAPPPALEPIVSDIGIHDPGCSSSEENIPASQEPTQRYLSQRSAITSTLVRTQSRNASGARPPTSYFEMVLIKAGVLLDEADNFVLSCDHVSFVSKLREVCTKCPNYLENVDIFKTGLRDALAPTSKYCLKLLSGCTINAAGEESVYQSQESMIVNFLMLHFLRDAVVEVLLDRIDEAAIKSTPLYLANGTVPLLPLLLTQLRYAAISHGAAIYEHIKSTFPKANETAKRDIIANAELVLDATKHDAFVQMLLDHVAASKDIFNANTMQALTNLTLSLAMQDQIRHRIMDYIQDDDFVNSALPQLINFLLKVLNEASDDDLRELVTTIRQILVWRIDTTIEQHTQLELFKYIEQALVRSKRFYSIWQKTIASLPATQFRSLDFITLLLLIHVKDDNYLYIENILRRRIKLEHINVNIFNEMKANYLCLLEQHITILMQLLHDFLRERHKVVADFAKVSYSVLFQICDSTQRSIMKKLLQLTCDKSPQNLTNLALELLRNIQRKYRTEIQNWGTLLMPLLDRIGDMSLAQTRLAMELVCSIAFPPPPLNECDILQDQIDMLLKKQIISRTATIKKQGIIGSVQLIDSMARIEETIIEHDDINASYSTASDLPNGRGKMAANFMMLVSSATMYCPESLALFYDELASICMRTSSDRPKCSQLDKPFLIWMCDMMTFYFQNNFVTEEQPAKTFGIELSCLKCINTPEDTMNTEESEVTLIAINISPLVLKPSNVASSSVLTLAPLFNLVRALHLQRYQGSLEQINALLGCAIVLPTFFEESNTDAIFYDYDDNMQKRVLDIYFYCVNWMRETVCSFSTQCEEMIRNKVLQRLTELIETEGKLRKLLLKAPIDYVPPQCQFIYPTARPITKCPARNKQATSAARSTNEKRSKAANAENNTEMTLFNESHANVTNLADLTVKLAGTGRTKSADHKPNFDVLYGPRETYRQLDSDIMLILREELSITYPLPSADVGKRIGLLELRFILNDLVCKLESITDAQRFQSEQPLQHIANPHYFMYDLSKFLSKIVANMQKLSKVIMTQLKNVKNIYSNADLFTEEFNYVKVCFHMCVRLLAAFFSWSQFDDTNTTSDLLKDSLLALLDQTKLKNLRSQSCGKLAADSFEVMHGYESGVMDLKTAVYLLELLGNLKRFCSNIAVEERNNLNEKLEKDMRTLCKKLLQRKWFAYDGSAEKGGTCNLYLDLLVKGFLKNSDFRRQMNILHALLDDCKQLNGKDSTLKSFPNIKKANFPLLFRGLCETAISELGNLINNTTTAYKGDRIKMWEKSCELFNALLDIVKALDIPRNFQLYLKYSHLYLKLLLQHGLQVFEQNLRQDPERVSEFLKNLQTITRFLHNLCCHSKALRHTAIISQIPALRETVETLVFRVKALMTANKCASVFSMGNLKNKDLHGDEILSQSTTLGDSGAAEHDSEEEIPDDESVDETILGQDETTATRRERPTTRNNRSKSSSRSKCF